MPDNIILNPGTGGASVRSEDVGGAPVVQIPVYKLHTGAANIDGGPITPTNPLDVRISDATNTASVKAASAAVAATDKSLAVGLHPSSPLPAGANAIGSVAQGTAAAVASAWPTKITDGTTAAAVKAASTAAVATDPALVVSLSPNNNSLANSLLTKTTDGTNIAAVKAASVAAAATDPALVVSVSPNSTVKTAQQNATAALTSVAASVASVTVLALNANRKGAMITNDSTSVVYIAFAATATATAFTAKLNAGDYYEVPFGYTGIITGIWVTAAGSARVTEIT
jgi:hypothetical protein